ncbi:unnamed protein product [Moneuplotes crassus]|uniref:Uncharacterized protein n=1 Tax=Euplotes crassus TaxID=5936 RepID=A0AAD1Y6S3_EUPCR|nr:unnamed protein product [Moneuplotes crassus]
MNESLFRSGSLWRHPLDLAGATPGPESEPKDLLVRRVAKKQLAVRFGGGRSWKVLDEVFQWV